MVQFDGTPESSKLLVVQNLVATIRNIPLKEKWPKIMSVDHLFDLIIKIIHNSTRILKYIDNYYTPLYNMLS